MRILLRLGDAQLREAHRRDVLADRILHVLLVEQDVQPLEFGIVRGHAAVIERQRVHPFGGHVLLREHDGQLLGAVVAVVEEDHHVAGTDRPDGFPLGVDTHDRLDELVGHVGVVGLLHGGDHVRRRLADTVHELIVGHLHTLPALVAIHRIVTADDRRDDARRLRRMALQRLNETLAAVRVGIAAVHEAVYIGMLDAVGLGDVAEFVEVVDRRVHAAVRHEAHEVHVHALRLGVLESRLHLRVLHDRTVLAGAVDLHQILIDHAARTDIEVSHLGVAHLPVGQPHVLAVGMQLRMGILLGHRRNICGMDGRNDVALGPVADAPTVQNHKQYFLFHCFILVYFNSSIISSTALSIAACNLSGFLPPAVAKKG